MPIIQFVVWAVAAVVASVVLQPAAAAAAATTDDVDLTLKRRRLEVPAFFAISYISTI